MCREPKVAVTLRRDVAVLWEGKSSQTPVLINSWDYRAGFRPLSLDLASASSRGA